MNLCKNIQAAFLSGEIGTDSSTIYNGFISYCLTN